MFSSENICLDSEQRKSISDEMQVSHVIFTTASAAKQFLQGTELFSVVIGSIACADPPDLLNDFIELFKKFAQRASASTLIVDGECSGTVQLQALLKSVANIESSLSIIVPEFAVGEDQVSNQIIVSSCRDLETPHFTDLKSILFQQGMKCLYDPITEETKPLLRILKQEAELDYVALRERIPTFTKSPQDFDFSTVSVEDIKAVTLKLREHVNKASFTTVSVLQRDLRHLLTLHVLKSAFDYAVNDGVHVAIQFLKEALQHYQSSVRDLSSLLRDAGFLFNQRQEPPIRLHARAATLQKILGDCKHIIHHSLNAVDDLTNYFVFFCRRFQKRSRLYPHPYRDNCHGSHSP